MTISTIALLNAFLAVAVVAGLAAVMAWPFSVSSARPAVERIERGDEELRRAA